MINIASASAPPMACSASHSVLRKFFRWAPGPTSASPCSKRKVQWPHRRLTQAWQECPGVSSRGVVSGGLLQAVGTECSSVCMGPFEGGRHYLHYLHHSLASGQTTGREHSPTHQQKIGLMIYSAGPHPSEQDPVSPSVSLSHQEASIGFLSFSIRRHTEWKPQSQKTNQSDHMDQSLV